MSKSKEEIEALLIKVDDLSVPITETKLTASQSTAYNYLVGYWELTPYHSYEADLLLVLCFEVLEDFCEANKE